MVDCISQNEKLPLRHHSYPMLSRVITFRPPTLNHLLALKSLGLGDLPIAAFFAISLLFFYLFFFLKHSPSPIYGVHGFVYRMKSIVKFHMCTKFPSRSRVHIKVALPFILSRSRMHSPSRVLFPTLFYTRLLRARNADILIFS